LISIPRLVSDLLKTRIFLSLLQNPESFAMLVKGKLTTFQAGIAQLVEQRTENPRVTSSSLVPGIINKTPETYSFQGFLISTKTPFQPSAKLP
jgi:hypothetical protein